MKKTSTEQWVLKTGRSPPLHNHMLPATQKATKRQPTKECTEMSTYQVLPTSWKPHLEEIYRDTHWEVNRVGQGSTEAASREQNHDVDRLVTNADLGRWLETQEASTCHCQLPLTADWERHSTQHSTKAWESASAHDQGKGNLITEAYVLVVNECHAIDVYNRLSPKVTTEAVRGSSHQSLVTSVSSSALIIQTITCTEIRAMEIIGIGTLNWMSRYGDEVPFESFLISYFSSRLWILAWCKWCQQAFYRLQISIHER